MTSIQFLSEGTYFFKNAELSNYMQRDNNWKNTFELWDFDGDNDQRWSLEHVRDGYLIRG